MSREIDAKVATEVMGFATALSSSGLGTKDGLIADVPHYSTDIAAAWQVVEKMVDEGYQFNLATNPGWIAEFIWIVDEDENTCEVWAEDTTPESAICKAALAAKGVSVE